MIRPVSHTATAQNLTVTPLNNKVQSPYHNLSFYKIKHEANFPDVSSNFPARALHTQPHRKFLKLKPTIHCLICSSFHSQSLEYLSLPVYNFLLLQSLAQILPFPESFLDSCRQNNYSLLFISKPHCSI